jgi:N,N'-diacetyllegionaminate synthase
MKNKTIIIAEIGENHLKNMEYAKEMIDLSVKAGVDYVKFQSFKGDQAVDDYPDKEWLFRVELSDEEHFMLKKYADEKGIKFLSAPFSRERAKFLVEKLGLKEIKIASSETVNLDMLSYLNGNIETIFFSTGITGIEEIRQSLALIKDVPNVYILHCVSEYPLPFKRANLSVIKTLQAEFPNNKIGYSDHTLGILAPIAAVSMGARVIEKHITLDKTMEGTDHIISADPKELTQMVNEIRDIEVLLGSPEKKLTEIEKNNREMLRTRFLR